MKKISSVFSFITAGLVFFFSTVSAYAQSSICPTGQFSALCNLKLNQGGTIVGRIVTILLIIAVIVALFFLVYGGIRWIMSAGDKGKLEGARGTVTGAIVGLVIALSAYFFLNIITYFFTKNTITSLNIPTIVP